MIPDRIAKLRRMHQASTHGEWLADGRMVIVNSQYDGSHVADCYGSDLSWGSDNAASIAESHNDLPVLLEFIEAWYQWRSASRVNPSDMHDAETRFRAARAALEEE